MAGKRMDRVVNCRELRETGGVPLRQGRLLMVRFICIDVLLLLTSADMASRRHILAKSPLSDHEDRLLLLELNSNTMVRSSSCSPTSDSSSDSEHIPESNDLAVSTSTSHPSAGSQYELHDAQPPAHTDLSAPHRPSSHPPPSGFTSARGDPDPSSNRDPERRLLSYQTHFQGMPAQSAQGGTFISAQNVNLHYYEEEDRPDRGIDILHRAAALEAFYDSAESFPQPRCHLETRTELLDSLYLWLTDPDSGCSIRWLHGPAGAGKSAVMQTLCQRLQDAGQLGGSFFFRRSHTTCGHARTLFATLAYQLALHRNELRDPISPSVEKNPSVVGRGMDVQVRTLIIEPCKLLQDATLSVLLIDGLDECAGHDIQREILRLIRSAASDRSLGLRILVASRPESHLQETFQENSFCGSFDSINIEQSFEDIRTYLRVEFTRIYREHHTTMGNIPTPWPSSHILDMLVEKSSGYFIYASTVIKFIDDEYSRPSKQLDIIQNLIPHDTQSPFQALDQLYIQVLMGVPARYRARLCDILSFIVHYPALYIAAQEVEKLLGLEPGDVSLILRPLHSLLKMSSKQRDIEVHHASFRDFLKNQERSLIFHVGCLRGACSRIKK